MKRTVYVRPKMLFGWLFFLLFAVVVIVAGAIEMPTAFRDTAVLKWFN